jgi:hypothetical protein
MPSPAVYKYLEVPCGSSQRGGHPGKPVETKFPPYSTARACLSSILEGYTNSYSLLVSVKHLLLFP